LQQVRAWNACISITMADGAAQKGQRRAGRPKVDSNEVLREFRASGWKPGSALDSASAHPGIMDAVRACVRPRDDVETHARQLCAFVFAHLRLGTMSMVDIFSADLWGTAVDPEWAEELMTLSDEDVALMSAGRLERAWHSPSLAAFVRTAQALDLPREAQILKSPIYSDRYSKYTRAPTFRRFSQSAVPQAAAGLSRFPLVAMTEKKAHEVRVLATVAAHLAYQHSLKVASPRARRPAPTPRPSTKERGERRGERGDMHSPGRRRSAACVIVRSQRGC
jgi:hypothetical protein